MPEIVINHATVREKADMLRFLDLCAERGMRTVSIWGDEIDKVGETAALARLKHHGLAVSGYNRIGPFTDDGLARAEQQLQQAARFGADHVFLFTGGLPAGTTDLPGAQRRAEEIIAGLLEIARPLGLKLALEPLHPMLMADRTLFASLAQANAMCARMGPGIGVVVDVHHTWWDPQLETEIKRAGQNGWLLGFHVNDWLVPTRDRLRDRGMMGDGVIDLAGIEGMVRRAGFTGPIEVEIFSDTWAARDPAEVIDIALDRCARIFGTAKAA